MSPFGHSRVPVPCRPTYADRMTHPTIEAYVQAVARMDAPGMRTTFADDIVLISPLTNAFRFRGAESVATVFASAFDVLTLDDVHTVTGADEAWAVVVRGHVSRRIPFEECQLLRLADDGRVAEITLIGRPVSALLAVMARIGPAMHRRGLMSRAAALASGGVRPLAGLMGLIERFVLPRMPPREVRGPGAAAN